MEEGRCELRLSSYADAPRCRNRCRSSSGKSVGHEIRRSQVRILPAPFLCGNPKLGVVSPRGSCSIVIKSCHTTQIYLIPLSHYWRLGEPQICTNVNGCVGFQKVYNKKSDERKISNGLFLRSVLVKVS